MKLKTIREQLLFAADYHHQQEKICLENHNVYYPKYKAIARRNKKQYEIHRKFSLAIDEALKLL